MWTFVVVLVIIRSIVGAENNIVLSDGWIPVSSEVVYNQIKHSSGSVPSYITAQSHTIQVLNTDINKVLPFQSKVKTQYDNREETNIFNNKCKDERNCVNQEAMNSHITDREHYFIPKFDTASTEKNETKADISRQSRKIKTDNFKNNLHILLTNEIKPESTNKEIILEKKYEVTEKLEDLFEEEETKMKETGYVYEPPKKQNETISSGLFEILSKYKINKDDDLPNYALSRRQMALTRSKPHEVVTPNQRQISYKSNNLNHLLVDPLLAVFLSNYGYYLQGMYGIHNGYNNLYGYLASNNIHNNRPFGFYKIFSDTDSSH